MGWSAIGYPIPFHDLSSLFKYSNHLAGALVFSDKPVYSHWVLRYPSGTNLIPGFAQKWDMPSKLHFLIHFSTKHSQNVQAILHCGGPLPGCVQYLAAVLEQILCPRRLPCIYDFYESFSRLVKFSLFPTICIWLWHSSLFLSGQISLAAASRYFFGIWWVDTNLWASFFSNIELQEF